MSEELETPPDLSVVIVNWNTRDLLRGCLASVPQGLRPGHAAEVWVVDNASRDGSAPMAAAEFPQVRLIANTDNVGFARANNQALRQATGRHLLLLNSDTEVLPGALSTMVDFLDAHPAVGAAGCRLLNADQTPQRSAWDSFPTLGTIAAGAFWLNRLPLLKRRLRAEEDRYAQATTPVPAKHLLGACLMVRRAALEQVGLMNEDYFMYLEETDWCHRIVTAGWGIVYLPTAQVIHFGQQSAALAPDKATADWCRSMCRFYRQHHPGAARMALLKGIISTSVVLRFLLGLAGRSAKRPTLRGCVGTLRALASA